ncbi:MAG: hypothetical protein NT011_01705 [Kiritimatiellaeota bacterium]|nr:hypothetical protein [Kiritimatiellota bacterium]
MHETYFLKTTAGVTCQATVVIDLIIRMRRDNIDYNRMGNAMARWIDKSRGKT